MALKPIPEGYRTVTPYLTVHGLPKLIEFVQKAFGATIVNKMSRPDGGGVACRIPHR